MFIDTHAHIYGKQFISDQKNMLERARTEGVQQIFLPAIDTETHADLLALAAAEPGYCMPMMGVHPCSINAADAARELAAAEAYLATHSFVAIGEIGIDLYWDKTTFELQKEAFLTQMAWAESLKLPIVIHSRDSMEAVIEVLTAAKWFTQGGILHCFTGNVTQAHQLIDLGFVLGIGGVATYKNGGLEPVLTEVSLENFVLETDAPYLAPVPFRGKRNESSYIKYVAERMAQLRGETIETIAAATTATARRIFRQ